MKLGEKILFLRKKKGLSQESLAEKIDVTRQTISNWELGETQPNPEQLKQLSKVFNVSIDELLDNDIQSILVEKVSNTEKLAGLILKILKIVLIGLPILFITIIILSYLYKVIIKNNDTGMKIEETIHCELYGEEHSFTIVYQGLTGVPEELGGDSYFSDILELDKYNDAHQIFNIINDYVKKNNGTCSMIENNDLNYIVDMHVKEGTLTNKGLTVVIETNKNYDITFGESFVIEKLNKNNEYEEVKPLADTDCVFNTIGYSVKKGKPFELKQDWSYCLGELPKGTYRIKKDVNFDSDRPITKEKEYYIWTEFIID